MASDSLPQAQNHTMTSQELIAFTQQELDTEAERQAQIAAEGSAGEVLQPGATLDYSKKNIHELPVEVILLFKDKVERLALSHNPQITIPKEIVQCDRLRYLNVRANKLTEFPKHVLSLSQLEILDLSKNEIVVIPETIKSMTSLRFLAIMRNKITRLPLALGDMSNLHKLKFEDNPIEFPSPEELQLAEDRNASGMQEMDKDREICQQVKRVLKSKALRQRLLKSPTEEEASESNVETPRPMRRTATGRFPVRPSISKIDLSEVTRSASNSPPDTQLTTKPSFTGTPTKSGIVASPTPLYANNSSRVRSESSSSTTTTTSTTASIRARRQGFVPGKRSTELGPVNESIGVNSTRSSNASTIKGMHAYKASTSSTVSGIGSSSGAETSSGPTSPISGASGDLKLMTAKRRQVERPLPPTKIPQSQAVHAARRLQFSIYQLHRPLHQVAVGIFNGQLKKSNLKRHFFGASALTEQLDKAVRLLDSHAVTGQDEVELKRKIMFLVHSAMKSFSAVMDCMQLHVQKISSILNPLHTRCLMHQLYATVVEARNVMQLLDVPVKYTTNDIKGPPRPLRTTIAQAAVTQPDTRSSTANRRLRGATILRNEISADALRVIPPAKSVDGSRSNTMTSFSNAATPASGDSFPMVQSAALPSRSNTMRLRHHSSDEHDEGTEQFEAIFLKLREACEIASKALPNCHNEVNLQIDNATRDGNRGAVRLWQSALKTYHKIAKAHQDLSDRLSAVRLKDPGVRTQKEFWQMCDMFVQSWTEFALSIKKLSQEGFDITTVRSLMKPMQRIVKDLSKTISDSPLYHQALRATSAAPRTLAPPFALSLNTASAQAVAQASSNPSSANPGSGMTVSVPATPLTAALGPAAQATLIGTPGAGAPLTDYFANVGNASIVTRATQDTYGPPNIATAPQIALPALPTQGGLGHGRR